MFFASFWAVSKHYEKNTFFPRHFFFHTLLRRTEHLILATHKLIAYKCGIPIRYAAMKKHQKGRIRKLRRTAKLVQKLSYCWPTSKNLTSFLFQIAVPLNLFSFTLIHLFRFRFIKLNRFDVEGIASFFYMLLLPSWLGAFMRSLVTL